VDELLLGRLITSSEGVFLKSNPHPRAYGSFIRVLGKFSRDEKVLPLQQAIYQLLNCRRQT
jgi:N-acyl-D-amino-acid deacylase